MDSDRGCSSEFHGTIVWVKAMLGALAVTAALVLAETAAVAAGPQRPAVTAASLVFDRVTVVDVEHGNLEAQTVVIVGNRIVSVGPAGQARPPKDARLVDGRGKYLIPGLWDLHVHPNGLAPFIYRLAIVGGLTGIRDAASVVRLDSLRKWQQEILAGTRVGPPRQLLAGMQIQGAPAQGIQDPVVAESLVADREARGADFIKMYPFSFALAAAARRHHIVFGGHLPIEERPAMAIEASDSGITHRSCEYVRRAGLALRRITSERRAMPTGGRPVPKEQYVVGAHPER